MVVPVPEAALLAVIAVLAGAGLRRLRWSIAVVAGFAAALLFGFGLGEAFFQAIYREHFSMWRNVRFLPDFLRMVSGIEVLARPELVVTATGLLIGVLTGVFALLLREIGATAMRLGRPAAVMLAGLLVLAGAWTTVEVIETRPAGVMLASQLVRGPGLGDAASAGTGEETGPAGGREQGAQAPPATSNAPTDHAESQGGTEPRYAFPVLVDEDVRIFIIESYGHTLFTREDHYELIAPVYDRLGAELDAAGFATYSHFMKSPAFGGRSWLADATILTGRWIGDQETYDTMWDVEEPSLVRIMDEAGYHTLLAAPGMTFLEEDFRELFPYDEIYRQGQLGYEGKRYSFGGGITDQFLLHRIRQKRDEATAAQRAAGLSGSSPFFGVYVMISSHVPFNVLPPFIEDWSTIGDGSVYNDLPRRIFDNDWLRGGEYPEGYTASIEYSLKTVVDYLVTFIDDGSLAVIIGDHQPRIPISERSSTFSVPVHVISRNEELVRRFSAFDFRPGLEPSQPTPHPGMDELQAMLLSAAGAPERVVARADER
jgi:hypothetical protein